MKESKRLRRLREILDRLEIVSRYDIRELTGKEASPEIVWKNLRFTVLASYDDNVFSAAERLLLFERACRIESVEFPPELNIRNYQPPYDLYPLSSGISNKVLEGSKSKGKSIDSVHLYLDGWNDYGGTTKGELGCYDMSTRWRPITFRFWASRRRLPSN